MDYRIEKDTLGEVKVPASKYWGAQTERSKQNFPIGNEKMPIEIIKAFAILKNSTAQAKDELGLLEKEKAVAYAIASAFSFSNNPSSSFASAVLFFHIPNVFIICFGIFLFLFLIFF